MSVFLRGIRSSVFLAAALGFSFPVLSPICLSPRHASTRVETTPLPDEVTDFSAMRERHYCYVDKTAQIAGLVPPQGSRRMAYLCRPEGFGKTLLLSTLRYYFEGRADLFEGLKGEPAAAERAVLCLDMKGMGHTKKRLTEAFSRYMSQLERQYSVPLKSGTNLLYCRLDDVLSAASKSSSQECNGTAGVVILIDNFHTPLVRSVGTPEEAEVRQFYEDLFISLRSHPKVFFLLAVGTLEGSHIQSELLLREFYWPDVSSDPEWAEVCGFSMPEIRETFADHIDGLRIQLGTARVLEEFEQHYVGFDFHTHIPKPQTQIRDPLRVLYRPNDVLRMLGVQTSSPEFWIQAPFPDQEELQFRTSADFARLRRANLVYVDKTSFIPKLVSLSENPSYKKEGPQYLLCRPQGFGKSLFCSMLQCYFAGRKDLFKGLDISKREETQWTARPVLRFSLTYGDFPDAESLRVIISDTLSEYEKVYGCGSETKDLGVRLRHLTTAIFKKTGLAPAMLIDDFYSLYYTMIDKEWDSVGAIYAEVVGAVKTGASGLHFVLVTGISNLPDFRGESLFNHLNNISLNSEFTLVCGFTRDELESNYWGQIERMGQKEKTSFDVIVELFLDLYSGYRFSPMNLTVMPPSAVVECLSNGEFHFNGWHLMRLLHNAIRKHVVNSADCVEKLLLSTTLRCTASELLGERNRTFEVQLYLLGYLTISKVLESGKLELCYPNEDVMNSTREYFFVEYGGPLPSIDNKVVIQCLVTKNIAGLTSILDRCLSSFSSFFRGEAIEYEMVYPTLLRFTLSLALEKESSVRVEAVSGEGRFGIKVHVKEFHYFLEFQMENGNEAPHQSAVETAAMQLINRGYWKPYPLESVILVAVEIDRGNHRVSNWFHIESDVVYSAFPEWKLVDTCWYADMKRNRWKDILSLAEKYD